MKEKIWNLLLTLDFSSPFRMNRRFVLKTEENTEVTQTLHRSHFTGITSRTEGKFNSVVKTWE